VYAHRDREPEQTINFVTCHDGFTLYDLVSYNQKHNEANREQNRDGTNDNLSFNHGVEGSTDDPEINALRLRQMRNYFCSTLLSIGAPMILMGDEVCRTQQGNNNAYCQDSALSWFDWSLVEKHTDLFRFVKVLIASRLMRDSASPGFDMSLADALKGPLVTWQVFPN
jgi:glycogen operon protein